MTISEIKESATMLRKLLKRQYLLELKIVGSKEKLRIAEIRDGRKAGKP